MLPISNIYFKRSMCFLLSAAVFLSACSEETVVLQVGSEADLIPEGIACYADNGHIYLSSIHKFKIVEFDPQSGKTTDFIREKENGYQHGVGIEIKGHLLYALSGSLTREQPESRLQVYDLKSGKLLREHFPADSAGPSWNDLAVATTGEIYVTDTGNHRVIRIQDATGSQEIFSSDNRLQYPNGIALSADEKRLFVASSTEGIRILETSGGQLLNGHQKDSALLGIDGLKYFDGTLYAIQNGSKNRALHSFLRIPLENLESETGPPEPLIPNHPAMNIPTTFSLCGNTAYILANSQLEQLDQQHNRILYPDSLTPTYLIKTLL